MFGKEAMNAMFMAEPATKKLTILIVGGTMAAFGVISTALFIARLMNANKINDAYCDNGINVTGKFSHLYTTL